eukprot:ANDGO_01943.mRNA.1 Plant UBX domain-containing protein 2
MASTVFLMGFGRHETFKVTPSTVLSQILDDFCVKNSLDSATMGLRYKQKDLELSTNIRISGLPPGAKIDVVRKSSAELSLDGEVKVAIQTPSGERVSCTVSSRGSLWDTLLLSKVHIPVDQEPSLVFMNRAYAGTRALMETSLIKIGAHPNSSCLLRLQFAPKASISESEESSPAAAAAAVNKSSPVVTPVNDVFLQSGDSGHATTILNAYEGQSKKSKTVATSEESFATDSPSPIIDRQVRVFIPSAQIPPVEVPDEYYDVTSEDIRHIISHQALESASNDVLKTQALRDQEAAKRARVYNRTIIRVRLPDGYILQAVFAPAEPMRSVYQFVRDHVENKDVQFELFQTPPRTVFADMGASLLSLKLVPAAILSVACGGQIFDIRSDLKASASTLDTAEVKITPVSVGGREIREESAADASSSSSSFGSSASAEQSREAKEKRLAKLMGLGKK